MFERWHPREGWGVFVLSFVMLMVVGLGVTGAGWTDGLDLVPIAGLGAFVIGLMIARSRLPGWLGHIFSLIIGFAWSFRLVTTLFPDFYTWNYRWAWLWWYVYQWTNKLFTGGVSHNNMIFILQMALIVWGITYLSVWFIFRTRQVWLAIVPGGILLLVNLYYAPKDITLYLVVYLALALLLVIRLNLFTQQQTWRQEQVHFNADEIGFDFLRAGALFTLVILALAWITPGVVVVQDSDVFDTIRAPWRDLQAEWTRLFASLNYRPTAGVDFYGRAMELGGPRTLAKVPVLEIQAPSSARYWRAVVFDEFTGRGWNNNDDQLVPFGADNEALPMVAYQARQVITSTVTLVGPSMSMLPMAAQPVWVSESARASLSYVRAPSEGASGQLNEALGAPQVDTISYARSRVPLKAGERYLVNSLLTKASARQLEQAGTNYPTWVTERYLQLPDTVPDRVKQLAGSLAAPYDNPYDKASAIESFLRSEITYNEKIEAPPPDRDPVDYILFDLKQGYCDYYATSMAVMLRSLDIPSRIVSGYAQGQYDQEKKAYVVLQQDAHTWVEVFFPSYGWVEFEPTAAQPAIIRPIDAQDANSGNENQNRDLGPTSPDRMDRLEMDEELPPPSGAEAGSLWLQLGQIKPTSWIGGSLVLAMLAVATVWSIRKRRLTRLSSVSSIYHNMLRLANWAGISMRLSQTPHEHASALGQQVPDGEKPAQRIAGLYSRERYGHKPFGETEQAAANGAWEELRPKLVRTILWRWARRYRG
jgi:hypothetical protein